MTQANTGEAGGNATTAAEHLTPPALRSAAIGSLAVEFGGPTADDIVNLAGTELITTLATEVAGILRDRAHQSSIPLEIKANGKLAVIMEDLLPRHEMLVALTARDVSSVFRLLQE